MGKKLQKKNLKHAAAVAGKAKKKLKNASAKGDRDAAKQGKLAMKAKKLIPKTGESEVAKSGAPEKGKKILKKRKVDNEADSKEGKTPLTAKKKKRKEVTQLYSELINPGRERNPDAVVQDIFELLEERATQMQEYGTTELGTRVLQACLKWGSKVQRQKLLTQLKEHLVKLSMDRHGHVMVLKLFSYTMRTSTDRKPTVAEKKLQVQILRTFTDAFRGKGLAQAFYHKYGCRVVNGLYFAEQLKGPEKRRLLHDVALPQAFSLLQKEAPGTTTLRQLLKSNELKAEQRTAIVSHLRECIDKAIDKELLGLDIQHLVVQAYCEVATEEQLKDLAEKCMPGAAYLLSSKAGAEGVLRLLGVANAKQRKAFCQDLKGKWTALTMNSVDYVVMIRLASTVDDTVLLSKTMLKEYAADIGDIAFDKYGHKVLAWMLKPDDSKFFSPYERECAALPAPASLKAAETRRQELVRTLKPMVRGALLAGPLKAAADLHAKDLLLAYLSVDWDVEIVEALLGACEAESAASDLGLLGTSGTATTTLLALLKLEPASTDVPFSEPLWKLLASRLQDAALSRCAFVMLELAKKGGKIGQEVKAAVVKQKKALEKGIASAEKAGNMVNGAKKLIEVATGK